MIYDTADPYTRRVVVDKGLMAGVELGAPVLDEAGILGQVTRVFPMLSEVTLLVDRDQAIPVLNIRTGARGVAYGDPVAGNNGGMELRFMPANADVREGDLLTTSGVDGLYPPACRWPRSCAWSAGPTRPLRASTASRWPRCKAHAM